MSGERAGWDKDEEDVIRIDGEGLDRTFCEGIR